MKDSKSKGASTSDEQPKRAKRERKKVTLLSSEFFTIYDDANNRQIKPNSKNNKKVKTITTAISTSSKKDGELSKGALCATIYQWIGFGRTKDDKVTSDRLYYDALEIKVGNHPAVIRIGDDVLLSSDDTEEADVFDKVTRTVNRNIDNGGSNRTSVNVAMNELTPYIGKVEEMWEEGARKSNKGQGSSVDDVSRTNRMKLLIRWYYKKEDVAGLRGVFDGIPRQKILSDLTPCDLLLGEIKDENEVSSVLGKCRVLRRKPGLLNPDPEKEIITKSKPTKRSREEGAFVCRFDISITPGTKVNKSKVTIKPYEGKDEEESPAPVKKPRGEIRGSNYIETIDSESFLANESTMDDVPSLTVKSDDDVRASINDVENEEDENDGSSVEDGEKDTFINRPPTTEGSAMQKIKVGEKHQAIIPPLVTGDSKVPSKRNFQPIFVWKPNAISDACLSAFIATVHRYLKSYMKEKQIEITRTVPDDLDQKHLPSDFTCREVNMDQIMKVLHDKSYNVDSALKSIKSSPQMYLSAWTKEDKVLYNAGFKKHFSAIRLISKSMGGNKKHKDVVDYHYRFKIPDQFRRYEDKKREEARRMLDCVEKHCLEEYLSTETAQAVSNAVNGMKKIQNWSKTGGGGMNAIGSVETMRLGATDFLQVLKETVGPRDYLTLVDHIKSLYARVITIPQCREVFQFHLSEHPHLMKRFDSFLPKHMVSED